MTHPLVLLPSLIARISVATSINYIGSGVFHFRANINFANVLFSQNIYLTRIQHRLLSNENNHYIFVGPLNWLNVCEMTLNLLFKDF